MKKTILCLSIFVVISTCFVTNVAAVPKITGIHGGYGVTATVEDADGLDWQINIIRLGKSSVKTEGTISGDSTTIRTPIFPPSLGVGLVGITVTIHRIFLPDIIEVRAAFMVGPFILIIHHITS